MNIWMQQGIYVILQKRDALNYKEFAKPNSALKKL